MGRPRVGSRGAAGLSWRCRPCGGPIMAKILAAVCVAAGLLGAGVVAALMAAGPPPAGKVAEKWEHGELHVQHGPKYVEAADGSTSSRLDAKGKVAWQTLGWATAAADVEA